MLLFGMWSLFADLATSWLRRAWLVSLAVTAVAWFCPIEMLAGEVRSQRRGDSCVLNWTGDEQIQVAFSCKAGLLRSPVQVRVNQRDLAFQGFYAVFNGQTDGYRTVSVKTELEERRIRVIHLLEHPQLPSTVQVSATLWMAPENKAIHFQIASDNGDRIHLDRLGIGNHQGPGVEPKRMYLGKMFVVEAPIEPFQIKYTYNSTRYWCFTMQNGITEMVGSDSVPRGFDFDPAKGTYDIHTYCDPSITYSFVYTEKGAQEAIAHYRSALKISPPPTLSQLPGRVTVMTGYPIKERYEDLLDELTGRGLRDFIWLAYAPWPGDRDLVEPYGALYSIYDMYTDLFAEGPRKVKGWTPEWVRYDTPGHMKRGYWNATRCLPELYIEMAQKRIQGTLGRELANRGFMETGWTRFYNLAIFKKEVRPSALYLDVHASMVPEHYWDHQGKHHPVGEHLRHEKEFFEWARQFLGNVPVFSEVDGEAFAGLMDGGIFSPWPPLEKLGIKAGSWEYYPFIDQVHRGWLLNSGAGAPFALDDYKIPNMGLAVQFGRPQVISAYPGTPQTSIGGRVQLYYLSSAYHKMLGLSGMDRVDLDGDSIHRQIASYSNGARIWSNRGKTDWEVEGLTLPPFGYLITGTNGFRQYRARKADDTVDVVQGPDYQYYGAERPVDFGPVVTSGALAVRALPNGRVMLYEVVKPRSQVQIRLGSLPGTMAGQKMSQAWIVLTRGRRIPLAFPDIQQEGDLIQFRPAEMATTVGYEIEFQKP